MIVGVSASRNLLPSAQHSTYLTKIQALGMTHLLHGDCVNGDVELAKIARANIRPLFITCYPPIDESLRAFFPDNDAVHPAQTYFARNRAIVRACDVLVACPPTKDWQPRGGTWMTIDYARKIGRRAIVIAPDGTVEDDWL